ncbi:MAG: leucine-rich repeat domain-containing protein, partial [Bacteroidales bacterium]|nr:leucine-rich repeat domain-containing protein [Bacteroidales bacterium]
SMKNKILLTILFSFLALMQAKADWSLSADGTLTITSDYEHSWSSDYPWNSKASSIKKIIIGNSVTTIAKNAFFDCNNIESIVVDEENTVFDSRNNCNAIIKTATNALIFGCQSTIIPEDVTTINAYAFVDCSNMTKIEIPSSVTHIGNYVFDGCSSLKSIFIPSSVVYIGRAIFSGCSSLTSIVVDENNTVYDSRNNCNAIIRTRPNTLVVGCQSTIIPEDVQCIGSYAFDGCDSLTDFEIPYGVTKIDSSAFYGCKRLTSIKIPSSVTRIWNRTFAYCSSLTSIEIPSSVTYIDGYAFTGCASLDSIEIPSSVRYLGDGVFDGCKSLTKVKIPTSVTSLGWNVFSGCSKLKSIELPSSITKIGLEAFEGCSSLASIEIPSSVSEIGSNAFKDCVSLTEVEIPSGVTSIDWYCFQNCRNLKSVTIPSTVKKFGWYVFSECNNLSIVNSYVTEPPAASTSLNGSVIVFIPQGTTEAYQKAWGKRNTYVEMGSVPDEVVAVMKDIALLSLSDINIENKETIASIIDAYNALPEEQKAQIVASLLQKLEKAEAAIAAINPTPVATIKADNKQSNEWYDLSGRRLQGKPATKGLYIHNGNKVLVK